MQRKITYLKKKIQEEDLNPPKKKEKVFEGPIQLD